MRMRSSRNSAGNEHTNHGYANELAHLRIDLDHGHGFRGGSALPRPNSITFPKSHSWTVRNRSARQTTARPWHGRLFRIRPCGLRIRDRVRPEPTASCSDPGQPVLTGSRLPEDFIEELQPFLFTPVVPAPDPDDFLEPASPATMKILALKHRETAACPPVPWEGQFGGCTQKVTMSDTRAGTTFRDSDAKTVGECTPIFRFCTSLTFENCEFAVSNRGFTPFRHCSNRTSFRVHQDFDSITAVAQMRPHAIA